MVTRVATIIFFLVFGLSYFFHFMYADLILSIDALVIAIAMMANA